MLLHYPAQRTLRIGGQRVRLIEEDDFEDSSTIRARPREILDLGADALKFPLVAGVHLEQVRSELLT